MIEIITADLKQTDHQRAVVELTEAYAQDPTVNGIPLSAEVNRTLVRKLQEHPTTHILLAYSDDQPVGIATCFLGFSTFAARPLLNLHDFAVLAEHRGQGIGRELMAAVVSMARELGCCKVTLEVDEHNDRARRLYFAAGFDRADSASQAGPWQFMTKPV